ncbi:unnamed protein product [Tilletia controversa]|uniref:WIBG Mago-binding domain-containing protein n=3 Tax=Tilletia TaxID=13289 RepID=A0A8X7SY14_9BASI|nr:hypothetical protein CF336_g803 [Tilletia laevis]KAE8249513.1 hypothetical protein A4X06_0g3198 [Tilletia controversa]KAE8264471.1 hypothetical protein A4X03_0g920 [Tilletia caries]KAE8208023.1 hypothetical protein CF335_g725 [Tilletia laevis]CAD6884388.1 unnamed protein product [Tilletia caries]
MSRPPLFPVASAAGIIEDPNTQQRVIPASVRPDGSVRKERRIKPGFTPQEDVTRFRSARQLAASNSRRIVPGSGIPGGPGSSTRIDLPASTSSTAGLSKAAKKNAKRRAARVASGAGDTAAFDDEDDDDEEEEEDIPDAWDEDDAEGSTGAGSKSARSPPQPPSSSSAGPSSSTTPQPNTASQPPTANGSTATTTPAADDSTTASEPIDPAKRAKALAKKIRAAEALRDKAGSGETLLPEQQAKVDSLDALTAELAELNVNDD